MNLKGLGHRQRKIIKHLQDNPACYIKHVMDAQDLSEDITMSDDDHNDYFTVPKSLALSLEKRKIIKIVSDWQPSIVIRIIKLKLA